MTEVNLQEALELVRARAEAKRWRASAAFGHAGAQTHQQPAVR
jgi:hypothetical protein